MVFRTQNKKTIIASMLMLFIFIASFGVLIAKSTNFSASNQKEEVLGEIVSAPVLNSNHSEVIAESQDGEESKAVENENNTNIQLNDEVKEDSQDSKPVTPGETCTPSLRAYIITGYEEVNPPYYRNGYLQGSFEVHCLDTKGMRFEWYIRGTGNPNNLAYQFLSMSNAPVFSKNLESGYYYLDYKVIVGGLTSEVKDILTLYTKPDIPENEPPRIEILQPYEDRYLYRIYYSTHVSLSIQLTVWARDTEDGGDLPDASVLWFLESESFPKQQIATGSRQYVTLTLPAEVCGDPEFKFTVIGTDSEALTTEVTKTIKVTDTVCHHIN